MALTDKNSVPFKTSLHSTDKTMTAGIMVDGKCAPCYGPESDDTNQIFTCWIESEAGKPFSVTFQATEVQVEVGIALDGHRVRGMLRRKHEVAPTDINSIVISDTLKRNFAFGSLNLTDDDSFLSASPSYSNIGEIKILIVEVDILSTIFGERKMDLPDSLTQPNKIHEKKKKAFSHQVRLGNEESTQKTHFCRVQPLRTLATFIFKYRPLAILQANGVAPPPITAPKERTLPRAVKHKLSITTDDDEEEGDLDKIALKLKTKLDDIQKKIRKKKAKKEPTPLNFSSSEHVIDLTV